MLWFWIILAALAGLIVLWYVSTHNKFIRLRNTCEEAFSTIDVYLKQRYDLIPNLVETVKGYAAHEKTALTDVINARNMAMTATTLEERQQAENVLTGTLRSLFALSESYPELKADSQFIQLQASLGRMEQDIAQSRKYYNAVVRQFNTAIEVFPASIVASIMKAQKIGYFEVDDPQERQNVRVDFS
jgi:LemA protein